MLVKEVSLAATPTNVLQGDIDMDAMHDWLEEDHLTIVPRIATSSSSSASTPLTTLNLALSKLPLAIAALRRAGPSYARRSEALWIFAAGSWPRYLYERKIEEASEKLPRCVSVYHDVTFAEKMVADAIAVLRRSDDGRDARDLEEAFELYQRT
ncbi:hypothetical protein LTR37_017228 [Vermiconidia calcicola]|uniref:Uncharacterized protein n=1 Tax=Vermiconidia calcicola TaxID=1690605 RepID=A0ACC3MKL8_9PEZI|nr:hypothetical protein LTR37_017228 [Vermiconidia calcicola]